MHEHKDFSKPSKPCHDGIYWIALTEYSQRSTHVPVFQLFLFFLHYFVFPKLAASSKKVNLRLIMTISTRFLSHL